jgi:hypothetical protein
MPGTKVRAVGEKCRRYGRLLKSNYCYGSNVEAKMKKNWLKLIVFFMISLLCVPAYAANIIQDLHNSSIQIQYWGPIVGQSFVAQDANIQSIGAYIVEMNSTSTPPDFNRSHLCW